VPRDLGVNPQGTRACTIGFLGSASRRTVLHRVQRQASARWLCVPFPPDSESGASTRAYPPTGWREVRLDRGAVVLRCSLVFVMDALLVLLVLRLVAGVDGKEFAGRTILPADRPPVWSGWAQLLRLPRAWLALYRGRLRLRVWPDYRLD